MSDCEHLHHLLDVGDECGCGYNSSTSDEKGVSSDDRCFITLNLRLYRTPSETIPFDELRITAWIEKNRFGATLATAC